MVPLFLKQLFIVFLLFVLPMKSLSQKSYEINFTLNDFEIYETDNNVQINSLKKCFNSSSLASYAVPYFPFRLLLPYGTTNVSYNIDWEKQLIKTNCNLTTLPFASTTNGDKLSYCPFEPKSILTPSDSFQIINKGFYKYLYLNITPFLYDKDSKELFFVSHINISFPTLREDTYSLLSEDYSTLFEDQCFFSKVENKNAALSYLEETSNPSRTNNPVDPIDYIIITNSQLAPSFETFVNWKKRKGLRTRILDVDSISQIQLFSGADTQIKIKECIYDYYTNHDTKWVLIAGDDSIVPPRYCVTMNEYGFSTAPTDLYYACFDGAFEWKTNFNPNTLIGPVYANGINFNPSVYLSRLPVRTPQDVINYTNKLLNYERDIPDMESANRVYFTGYSDPVIRIHTAEEFNDSIYDNYINPYWNGDIFYYYDINNNYVPAEYDIFGPIYPDIIDQMCRHYNLIHVVAEGYYDRYDFDWQDYTVFDAYQAINDFPSIVLTNACHTNRFDSNIGTCLSEALIRNGDGGAISYFGSSREGWNNTGMADCSFMYDGLFFKNLFTGQPNDAPYSFGSVAAQAKRDMIEQSGGFGYNFWLQYSINPIGDPEMQIYTETPNSFVTSHNGALYEPVVVQNNSLGQISVYSTTDGCKIVLIDSSGEIHVQENVQNATFTGLSGECQLTILKHNYKPYLKTIDLSSNPFFEPFSLNIQRDGQGNVITQIIRRINPEGSYQEAVDNEIWTINVFNSLTGEMKINDLVNSSNYSFNTNGWNQGVYIVKAMGQNVQDFKKITIQ